MDMRTAAAVITTFMAIVNLAHAAAPRVIYPTERVTVRPGGTSYTWTYGLADTPSLPGQQFQTKDIAQYDVPVSGFNWILTRGRFEYSTDNGGSWTTLVHPTSFSPAYTPVAGKIFRFVDTKPGDTTTNDNIGVSWTLVGNGDTVSSGRSIQVDLAPTDIVSSSALIFDDSPLNFVLASLTPTDVGDNRGGYWQIDSQSNANLFTITYDNTQTDTAQLRKGSAAMPAIGQMVNVTARYFDLYQTDATGAPLPGSGFAKAFSYTVTQNSTTDLAGFGPEFPVNVTTANNQQAPAIARLSNGNFVAVWRSVAQDSDTGSAGGIYARIFNAAGTPQGGEFRISPLDNVSQNQPTVAALSANRFVVAYTDVSNGGDVYYRLVNADTSLGSVLSPHAVSAGNEGAPRVATLSDGNFAMVWTNSLNDISGRVFNGTNGSPLAAEFTVNALTTGTQSQPDIAGLDNSRFVVVWRDNANSGDVYARFASSAGPTGSDITVAGGANNQANARVAGFADGKFTIAFTDQARDGDAAGEANVYVQRFDATGAAVGGQARANAIVTGNQSQPAISGFSDGSVVVSWTSPLQDLDSNGVFGRRFGAAGSAIDASDFQVNEKRQFGQNASALSAGASGGFAAIWVDASQEGQGVANQGVEARVYSGIATPSASITVSPASVAEDGVTNLTYAVTLSPMVPTATTVNIATSGTAVSGNDYTGAVSTLTIPANTASATITINPTTDTTVEPDETVILTVTSGTGYTVGTPSSATGTILNDDFLPPSVSKFFVNSSQGNTNNTTLNGTARLAIAITNPSGNGTSLSGLAITDNFPPGMVVDAVPNPTNTCGGSFAPTPGGTSISLSGGGPLTAANQCTISVMVRATSAGALVNTTGNVSSIEGGAGGTASGTLNVYAPPVVNKSFTPTTIALNQTAVLRLEIQSPTAGLNLSGVNLTDNFPAGMVAGSPALISTTNCGGLVVTDSGGGSFQTGDTGVRLNNFLAPAPVPCVVEMNVVAQTSGALVNTTDAPTSTNGGTGLAATATLTVAPSADLSIIKSDGVTTAVPGGSVTYTIIASNAGPDPVTGATVSDTFPASLTCTWTCLGAGGGTCTASGSGNISNSVNLPSGASVTHTASCTISASATGSLSNTATVSSAVFDPNGSNNNATDIDTLTPQANLGITKSDGVTSVNALSSTTYTITASNAGPSNVASATVADTFPAFCVAPTWTCTGAGGGTCTASGSGNINNSVNLPAGGSVTYTAVCPVSGAATGTLVNTATVTSATTDPVPANNSATDTDTIIARPSTSVVSLNRASGNPRNAPTATWMITFATPISGLTAANFAAINGGLGGAIVVSPPTEAVGPPSASWNVTVSTGTGSGTLGLNLVNDDGMSHSIGNLPFVGQTFTIDRMAPTAVITMNDTALKIGDSSLVTFSFSEAVTGFDNSDLTIPNGNLTAVSSSNGDVTFTGTYTPNANVEAPVNVIALNMSGVADLAGNTGVGTSNSPNFGIDTLRPTVGIVVADDNLLAGETSLVTFSFSEAVTGFTNADLSIENGNLTPVSSSNGGLTFTATLTPTASIIDPSNLITVDNTGVADSAGNAGSGSTSSNNYAINTVRPTVGVVVADSVLVAGETSLVTFTFSEAVSGFDNADLTIGNGTLSPVITSDGGVTFTATLTPTAGINAPTNVITVNNTGYTNAAGNAGSGSSDSNNYAIDTVSRSLSINDVSVTELDAGSNNLSFTVTVTPAAADGGVSFSIATQDGTALAASDYAAKSLTGQTIAAGASTATFTVSVNGDNLVELDETVLVNLSAVTGAVIGDGQGVGTITNNDSATVQFAPSTLSQLEGSSPMAFTVTLSNPVDTAVTLAVNSAFGTATAADFTPIVAGSVNFPAGSTTRTVNVTINPDALDEDDEGYSLTLSALSAAGRNVTLGTAVANGTILDDDALPVLSINSPSQLEGNVGNTPMNFVVTLTPVSGRDVSFTRATANGSATLANNDYLQLTAATVTIAAGSTSATIPVSIVGDNAFEGNESFSLNITGVSNATPGSLSGTGTILEDDAQPTTTVVNSAVQEPTLVGQPYTVSVTVTAQTSSPLGAVTIRDGGPGSPNCVATLIAGTSPISSGSCLLTSTSAGAKTLTADYAPANGEYQPSTGTGAHQVNTASTTISASGPPRVRINTSNSFSFALSVDAPGGGSPAGTVTLSSGASSCAVTVPTATPSCSLSFNALGARTVSAAFVPSDSNYNGSNSAGAGNAQTLVFARSDLAVTKSDAISYYQPGDLIVYTVTVRNLGPDTAENFRIVDTIPAGLSNTVWSCDSSGGATCPQTDGVGSLDVTVASFIPGALLNFTFFGNALAAPGSISNTAMVVLPTDSTVEDPTPGNNSATDINLRDLLFADGFEEPIVNAPTGSFRLPSSALRNAIAEVASAVYTLTDTHGKAVQVYARMFDGQLQYALAARNSDGLLRLGGWRSFDQEPTLSWTAQATDAGWALTGASLD